MDCLVASQIEDIEMRLRSQIPIDHFDKPALFLVKILAKLCVFLCCFIGC